MRRNMITAVGNPTDARENTNITGTEIQRKEILQQKSTEQKQQK
jgi:hypothetical protein